jgi:hypothetical protein
MNTRAHEFEAFWMVYGEGQRAPAYVHQTAPSAVAEARRLAREHPGIRFYVLAAIRGFVSTDPVIELAFDDGIPF